MTHDEIKKLVSEANFTKDCARPQLIETHISWVILCDRYVYKIKKPVRYSFLDFSTLDKRAFYCAREIELNRRLTHDLYLDVQPVLDLKGHDRIGGNTGPIIDYAVRMRKLDSRAQMNVMLLNNTVTIDHIRRLAEKIASFHQNAVIVYDKDLDALRREFNDLDNEKENLAKYLGQDCIKCIDAVITFSDSFLRSKGELLKKRLDSGFYRDCHGDLHSRNIFLLPDPVPFDCIEFNDDFRRIDVLNEIAFLCMDLDAYGKSDLSRIFLHRYNRQFPVIKTMGDYRLFIYYKLYRANVRAKVNSLRIRSASNDEERRLPIAEARKYIDLMNGYLVLVK